MLHFVNFFKQIHCLQHVATCPFLGCCFSFCLLLVTVATLCFFKKKLDAVVFWWMTIKEGIEISLKSEKIPRQQSHEIDNFTCLESLKRY